MKFPEKWTPGSQHHHNTWVNIPQNMVPNDNYLSTSLCCLQTLSTYLGVAFGAMGVAILELWIQAFPTW